MNKKEYIYEITKSIKNRREKEEVRRELECHLEDRERFYLGAGYDEKTAESKTLQKMGDAEQIGQSLGRLHSNRFYGNCLFAFCLVLGALRLYHYFFYYNSSRLGISAIREEYFLLLIAAVFGYIGIKNKYKSIFSLGFLPYLLFIFNSGVIFKEKSIREYGDTVSGIVFSISRILSGKVKELAVVAKDLEFTYLDVSKRLKTLSLPLYAFIVLLFIAGLIFIILSQKGKPSLVTLKTAKIFKTVFLTMIILFGCFYAATEIICLSEKTTYYSLINIYASDSGQEADSEKIAFWQNPDYDYSAFVYGAVIDRESSFIEVSKDADGEPNIALSESWEEYGEDIKYMAQDAHMYLTLLTDEKYLCFEKEDYTSQKDQVIYETGKNEYVIGLEGGTLPLNRIIFHIQKDK